MGEPELVPYLHLINIGRRTRKNRQWTKDNGHGTAWIAAQMARRHRDGVINVSLSLSPPYPPLAIQNSLQQMAHPFHLSICVSLCLLLPCLLILFLLWRSIYIIIHILGACTTHRLPCGRHIASLPAATNMPHDCFTGYAVAGHCVSACTCFCFNK